MEYFVDPYSHLNADWGLASTSPWSRYTPADTDQVAILVGKGEEERMCYPGLCCLIQRRELVCNYFTLQLSDLLCPGQFGSLSWPLLFVLIYVGLREMLKLLFYFFSEQLHVCVSVLLLELSCSLSQGYLVLLAFDFTYAKESEGVPADNLLFFKVVSCLSEFWSCLEEALLRQLEKAITIKGIWKHEFCCWTQSLNILDQGLRFLSQFLHLDYGNVIQYRDGVIGHKFEL